MGVKLFLIRHGQTELNLEGRYQGGMDTELTSVGIRQAKLAKKYLSMVIFSSIYSSPLKRALNTASIIADNGSPKVIVRDNLKEIDFGKWEGLKFNEINRKYKKEYQNWLNDPFNKPPTGGESFKSLTKRVTKEIDKIVSENDDGGNVAIITHGGVIVSLLVYWLRIPYSRWRSIIQRQGAINIVVIDKNFPYISQINYTGHLKPIYDDSEDKVIEIYSKLGNKKIN